MECKVAISAFRRNYLCIIDVVLCHGKYKGCGVVLDGSTMAVCLYCDIGNGGCGVYIRFNAVVRFVVPFSFGFSSVVR